MHFNSDTVIPITSSFQFTTVDLKALGATEYTLVCIAADCSGSVSPFAREEEKALMEIVQACRKSPRADNLLLRMMRFGSDLEEIHGFKPLQDLQAAQYANILDGGGCTALFDAAVNAVNAVADQGEVLIANDFSANAIIFVITDGADNSSSATPATVKAAVERAMQAERLESIVTVLIGVNVGQPEIARALRDFSGKAGFTQYVELKDATSSTLAKLASFVSKSISSQSQALGTGGPSQSLTF